MRAVIFANGQRDDDCVIRLRADDYLIAADGGAVHARRLNLTPQIVLGDFDSLDPASRAALERAGTRFELYPSSKDETDLELALLHALAQNADPIAIVSALGGRLDMTMANLMLLTHPRITHERVEFWNGTQTAWLLHPPGEMIHGAVGDTLSLLPLHGPVEGIRTDGLAYPLEDETLYVGPARGVSNVFTETTAQVELRAGWLLAVHTPGRA